MCVRVLACICAHAHVHVCVCVCDCVMRVGVRDCLLRAAEVVLREVHPAVCVCVRAALSYDDRC